MTAEQERDALAEAIVAAGVKAGIVNNDAPLTGPHLIMICDDLAGIAEAAELRGAERMRERCVAAARGREADWYRPITNALAALPLEEGEG